MNTAQKIIKYCAIGFAAILIVSILSGIIFGVLGIVTAGRLIKDNSEISLSCEESEKYCMTLSIAASELEVKKGEKLSVETENEKVEVKQGENTLVVKENGSSWSWFGKNEEKKIVVYVPEDMQFDKVGISSGAGRIYVEKLDAKELEVALGVGEAVFDALETENAKISAGIGSVRINLLSKAEDYTVNLSKGIGEVKFNDVTIGSDSTIGSGSKKIDISGGIGEIVVKTAK